MCCSDSYARRVPTPSRTLNRDILRLAVPALGSLVAEPLFLIVDSALVGHLGVTPLAGLGIASAVLQTIVGLMVFLAYATTPAVARRFGAGDPTRAVSVGIDGMWLALGIGAILALAGYLTTPFLVGLFGASPEVARDAETYLGISMWGLPAMLIVFAATGLLRGMQDTVTPLWIAGLGFGANALLNWLFIYGFGWGIGGSAFGTVVAQWGMVAAYVVVIGRLARTHSASVRPHREGVRGSARSGGWLFLRTLTLRAALLATVFVATGLGTEELAGWQVAFTIFSTAAFALDALAIAAQALIGKGLGAGDTGEVQRTLGAHRVVGRLVRGDRRRGDRRAVGCDRAAVHRGCRARRPHSAGADRARRGAAGLRSGVRARRGADRGGGREVPRDRRSPEPRALRARAHRARGAERGRRGRTRLARGRLLRGLHAGAARDPRLARPRRRLDDRRGVGVQAQRRHHSYITTAAAADALIERVEPYCVISTVPDAAASASGERPGPS